MCLYLGLSLGQLLIRRQELLLVLLVGQLEHGDAVNSCAGHFG